jgi:hypothetical protein
VRKGPGGTSLAAYSTPHLGINPGTRADAREQSELGQRANKLMEGSIVHLLACTKASGDKERIYSRGISETIVGQECETGLQ